MENHSKSWSPDVNLEKIKKKIMENTIKIVRETKTAYKPNTKRNLTTN